jgi:hypothetical protein
MGLPEDWEINRDEDEIEIRWIDVLTEKELEQQVEADVTNLFKSLGITVNKVARSEQMEQENVGPVILINKFNVKPEDVDQFLRAGTADTE